MVGADIFYFLLNPPLSLFAWTTFSHRSQTAWLVDNKLVINLLIKLFQIYSFGINNEWSFEDVMDSVGCKGNNFQGKSIMY